MTPGLDSYALAAGLIGGLALFLFGLDILTRALKQTAGDYIRSTLARMTSNRFVGLAAGTTVTAVIQSSSITTVLLVGFISAGLMSTSQSVSVIIGANIGTTVTAQILAFKATEIALPILATGFFVSFVTKRENWRQYGLIVLGLGLVFFGMHVMSEAMKPLRGYQPFLDFMISLDHPLLAALAGAIFTAIIQSSSATTGTVIVMAGEGLLGLEAAIAIALGANIGTCITAVLASIGKPREAIRAALVHTIFNVGGVVIWIGFVGGLADLARLISPLHPELSGIDRSAAEIPRQIANIHTFFNVANAAIFIGFTTQLTRLVEWLAPDRPLMPDTGVRPRFLDDQLLDTPSIALDGARREVVRLGGLVRDMLEAVLSPALSGTRLQLSEIAAMDSGVNILHREIIGYLRQVSLTSLSTTQSDILIALIKITNDLEHIGDRIALDIVESARKRIEENVVVSRPTVDAIRKLHTKVVEALDGALTALETEDAERAKQVRAMKQNLHELLEDLAHHQLSRLKADEPHRLMTYAREIELIETLDDIFKTIRRISRTQIQIYSAAGGNHIATESLNTP
jgi:phosphate:Na+ symporter